MKTNMGGAIEFFYSIPDEVLVKIAQYDWDALESLCIALTLDFQLIEEEKRRAKKDLAS